MSQKIKLILSFILVCLVDITASAHDIEVVNSDGVPIYYTYYMTGYRLRVTYKGDSYNSFDNEYSGVVVIPDSVTYNGRTIEVEAIDPDAFRDCTELTSVVIPNTITSVQGFKGCTGLTSITLPNSVTTVGGFEGCAGLTSITLPNNVVSIDESAFAGCTGLTSIILPNSVTSIGRSAFSYCI